MRDKPETFIGAKQMGGSSRTTTTQHSGQAIRDPWSPAKSGLESAAQGVTDWMNDPNSKAVYSGPRVAGMSDMTRQGIADYGAASGAKQATQFYSGMIGQGINRENPYLKDLQASITSSVMPSINAQFSNAGMGGSTLHQEDVARGLSQGMAPTMFNAAEAVANRQMQAAAALPGTEARIGDQAIRSGQALEGYDQANIDVARQLFDEQQNANLKPYATAMPLLSTLGGMGWTNSDTSNSNTTERENPSLGSQIMGGLMMGAGMMSGNPMGMIGSGMGAMGRSNLGPRNWGMQNDPRMSWGNGTKDGWNY